MYKDPEYKPNWRNVVIMFLLAFCVALMFYLGYWFPGNPIALLAAQTIFFILLATFFALTVYALLLRGKSLRSGKEIAHLPAEIQGEAYESTIHCTGVFDISTSGVWCRIGLRIKLLASAKGARGYAGLFPFKYKLEIWNLAGELLYREEDDLGPYARAALTNIESGSFLVREHSVSGYVPILEFIPPGAGRYRVFLEMARFQGQAGVQQLDLYVKENVIPLSVKKGYAYPPPKVRLSRPIVPDE